MGIFSKEVEKVETLSGNAMQAVEHAANSVHGAIDQAAGATMPVVERVASGVHQATATVANAASHAAQRLGERGDQLNAARRQLGDACHTSLRDQPYAVLGIAVAAGLLVGWLLRRRE